MISWIRFKRKLWRLGKEQAKTAKLYHKLIREAHKNKADRNKIEDLEREYEWERSMLYDEERALHTGRLIGIAIDYMVPLPQDSSAENVWDYSSQTGDRWLTPIAFQKLRDVVRKERKDRYDYLFIWATVLTGIIGSSTGLVSVLLSK